MNNKSRTPLVLALSISLLLPSLPSCRRECSHPYLVEQTVNATCDQEGKIIHSCRDCGYEYATDIVPPKGHRMQDLTTDPTCEAQGSTTHVCLDCGYTFTAEYTVPLDHDIKEKTISPSCTEQGYTEHRCSRCEYIYKDNLVAPSHDLKPTTVAVTCTHSGYTEHACENCEYSYRDYVHYTDLLPSAYVENTTVLAKGLDVSKYNHKKDASGNYLPLDWNAIKAAGFDYVILKVGSTVRDNGTAGGKEVTFEMDYAGAKAAGLDVGVYFFTYAESVEQNRSDADMVALWLEGKTLEYPVYYDIENDSFDENPQDSILPDLPDRKTLTDFCVAFIERMQEKGFYCGLYCNKDWLENHLDTSRCTSLFDIWYARYRDIQNDYPSTEAFTWNYGDQLGMWQYACTGTIAGFEKTHFDFNYAYKDFPSIMEEWHLNGY